MRGTGFRAKGNAPGEGCEKGGRYSGACRGSNVLSHCGRRRLLGEAPFTPTLGGVVSGMSQDTEKKGPPVPVMMSEEVDIAQLRNRSELSDVCCRSRPQLPPNQL